MVVFTAVLASVDEVTEEDFPVAILLHLQQARDTTSHIGTSHRGATKNFVLTTREGTHNLCTGSAEFVVIKLLLTKL